MSNMPKDNETQQGNLDACLTFSKEFFSFS